MSLPVSYTIGCVISVLGLIGNSVSVVVLSLPEMKSPLRILLLGLAFFDSTFLLSYIVHLLKDDTFNQTFGYIISFLVSVGQMGSVLTTVVIAVERFIVTTWPLESRTRLTKSKSKYTILCVLILSILLILPLNIPLWIDLTLIPKKTLLIIVLCSPFVCYVIPFVVLLSLTVLIYNNIRKARQTRVKLTSQQGTENSQTLILICIVLVFGICYSPQVISLVSIVVCYFHPAAWCKILVTTVVPIVPIATVINSSVNFIIYIVVGKNFRNATVSRCRRLLCNPTEQNSLTNLSSQSTN